MRTDATNSRIDHLLHQVHELRLAVADIEAIATRQQEALLRIVAAGELDDVDSLRQVAAEALGIEEQHHA